MRFAILCIGSDNFSRQYLAIHLGQPLKGEDVTGVMEQIKND
jgi:hypothetical protein